MRLSMEDFSEDETEGECITCGHYDSVQVLDDGDLERWAILDRKTRLCRECFEDALRDQGQSCSCSNGCNDCLGLSHRM